MISFKTIKYISGYLNLKTIYFNFKYFSFSTAIKFPVFVSNHFILKECKGTIELCTDKITGMIKLGYGNIGIFDRQMSRGIWEVRGCVKFYGGVYLGQGSKISVGDKGLLSLGNNVVSTAECSIICFKKITISQDCLISWEVMIMDTDFHKIHLQTGEIINPDKEILIGKHVWIGARSTLLKGTVIADNCVIGANTLVATELLTPGCVYGGQPVKILKEKITWEG